METASQIRLNSLERANYARLDAASIRQSLSAGEMTLGQAIRDPRAGSMTIERLLRAMRRVGPLKAHSALRAAGIHNSSRRVRDLTDRQIDVILAYFSADSWQR